MTNQIIKVFGLFTVQIGFLAPAQKVSSDRRENSRQNESPILLKISPEIPTKLHLKMQNIIQMCISPYILEKERNSQNSFFENSSSRLSTW
jgi:hypothetical protein